MSDFRYKALTASGQTVEGIRSAPDAESLAGELLEQGLIVLRTRRHLGALGRLLRARSGALNRELRDFTQHMATCLAAGIPALTALEDFQSQSKGDFRAVILDIRNDVASGTGLDEAFMRHPEVFNPVYLSLIAAGQHSGGLDAAFDELVAYLEWNENMRAQTTQALIYPLILLSGVIGLFLLMLLFVLPRFEAIFNGVDFKLPAVTRMSLAAAAFLGSWWWLILTFVVLLGYGYRLATLTARGAYLRDRALLALPVVGGFVHKLALSRFAKTFSLIFASGVDLLKLLDLVQNVVGNSVMARQLALIRQRVATGESLQQAFADADVFPPLLQRLVAVGEKTGSLDSSLLRASQYLDRELPRDLKRTFAIFEAAVLVLLGALVCVAALSLIMPIMQIRSSIR